jgi:hypothetical protein
MIFLTAPFNILNKINFLSFLQQEKPIEKNGTLLVGEFIDLRGHVFGPEKADLRRRQDRGAGGGWSHPLGVVTAEKIFQRRSIQQCVGF